MSLKHERWQPTTGRTDLSHTAHIVRDSIRTFQSSTAFPAARQPSLHAHPRQSHQTRQRINHRLSDDQDISKSPSKALHITVLKRRAGVNPDTEHILPRRAQRTSQGTVLVNRRARSAGQQKFELPVDAVNLDFLKRQAERGYYEQWDGNGVVRRRSMMRTVSKEDYLLGRGANPRTGLITPGGGSIDSNIDVTEDMLDRNIAPSAKWKQRGDQWVSLDVDEPTPTATPYGEPPFPTPQVRRPQTPRRFSEQNSSLMAKASAKRGRSHTRGIPPLGGSEYPLLPLLSHESLPGTFPESPGKHLSHEQTRPQTLDPVIRRKPVGESPLKKKPDNGTLLPASADSQAPITPTQALNTNSRSFSAPNSHKQYFSPNQIGEDVPNVPDLGEIQKIARQAQDDLLGDKSFLGVRSPTSTNLDQRSSSTRIPARIDFDKELPCLPMSSGQYLQTHSDTDPFMIPSPPDLDDLYIQGQHQQRQTGNSRSIGRTSRKSHISRMIVPSDQVKLGKRLDSTTSQGICCVPDYDNPPRNLMPKQKKPAMGDPRMVTHLVQSKAQRSTMAAVSMNPLSTTSMSTDTLIHMGNHRGLRQHRNTRIRSRPHPPPSIPLPPTPRPVVGPTSLFMPTISNIDDESVMKSSPPCIPPRSLSRPRMASRAAGMAQLPQMNERKQTHMAPHDRLNTTGMHARHPRTTDTQGMIPLGDLHIPQNQLSSTPKDTVGNNEHDTQEVSATCLSRRCSRCQNGFVAPKLHSTDGQMDVARPRKLSRNSANAPEALMMVQTSAHVTEVAALRFSGDSMSMQSGTTSATILNVEEDLRDHSICCPECCKMNCHEGCLGHPMPAPSPTRNTFHTEKITRPRTDSSSTLVSTSGESSSLSGTEERKPKLSFMKSAFKVPFWQKRSDTISPNSSNNNLNGADAQTKFTLTSSDGLHALRTLDGNSGTVGAVAAAKRAIGFDSSKSGHENGLNQLMIPKRRPQANKAAKVNTAEKDVASTLTPPATPPSVKVNIAANERRRISGSRPCSGNQSITVLYPSQNRAVSGGSIDVRIPSIDGMGLASLSEFLVVVPFEALRMWLHNNPQVMGFGWSALDCGWSMGCVVAATGRMLLNATYIYSKTGRFKVKDVKGGRIGMLELVADSLRSMLYLLVFISLAIMLGRVMRIVFWPLQMVVSGGQYLIVGRRQAGVL